MAENEFRAKAFAQLEARTTRYTNGCWIWDGPKGVGGYGRISVEGRFLYVHRLAHELLIGPIPVGFEVHHSCEHPACWNPLHVRAVSVREHTLLLTPGSLGYVNYRKTHCIHGHPFTPDNTYFRIDVKGRRCRTCDSLKYQEKRRRQIVSDSSSAPPCP